MKNVSVNDLEDTNFTKNIYETRNFINMRIITFYKFSYSIIIKDPKIIIYAYIYIYIIW